MNRGVWLTENERQLRRVGEGRPTEGVEQLSFGERQMWGLPNWRCGLRPNSALLATKPAAGAIPRSARIAKGQVAASARPVSAWVTAVA